MRKVKLFFLLTALLAIAQGAWAATKTFTTFVTMGINHNYTQSPVTVNCTAGSEGLVIIANGYNMTISVSAGYTITEVKLEFLGNFNFFGESNYPPLTATYGTLSNNRPGKGATVTVSNVNNTQTVLSSSGVYTINNWIQVTYTPVNYTISYNLGGGSISGSYPTSYNIETNTFTLKNPTRSGYTFTGWTGSNGNTKQTSVSINKGSTGNKTYTANWQVNQASVTTAPTAKTGLTYNGSAKALVNAGAASNGTMYYKLSTSGSWSTSIPTATNAGSYTVQYYAQGTGGASSSGTGSVQVTIAKANPTVTAPTAKANLTYSGSAQALVNAGSTNGGTMQYKVGSGSWGTSIPTGTNAGSYTVYYKVEGNSNYNGNNGSNFQVTIAKANPTVTAPTANANLTYSGSAQALVNAGSTTGGTMKYSLDNSTWNTAIPTGTNAGSYTVYYKVEGNSNYNGNNGSNFQVTIAKSSTITIATVPAAIENLEYTGDAQPLATAGSSPDGTMMYSLDGTNWSEDIPTGTAVGDYTVYYYVKGDANHNDGAVQSFNVSIAEKASAAMGDSGDNTVVGADISSFLAAQNGHTIENVAIVRPVYRNTYYNTLCLPFDLPSLTGTILDGFKVMELSGISVSGGTLHVELEEATSIVAGKPYFVKYEAETDILNQLDFTDVTINDADLIDNAVTIDGVTFRGTFAPYAMEAQTEENHSYLFLGQNDVLYWPNANGNLLSFRAFFVINTGANNSPIRRGMPARIVENHQTTTDFENVQNNVRSEKVMENGVLYIIKNGVKYNAQGQEVR